MNPCSKISRPFALLVLILFGQGSAVALASDAALISEGLSELAKLTSAIPRDPQCFVGQEESGKTCSEISDDFCKVLKDRQGGNMRLFDGKILAGNSPKSKLSWAQIMDLRALVGSKERLPADFRRLADPILGRLDYILKNESDSLDWKRQLSDVERALRWAEEDIAKERWEKKYPRLNGKRQEQMAADDRPLARQVRAELRDEIVIAKYAESPNWKRVERLVSLAKEDIAKAIGTMPVSAALREQMKERVRTIELKLPLPNPETAGVSAACGTTSVNANYTYSRHALTICAGFFNVYQSDSAMMNSIMHEISHSVDPHAMGTHDCRKNSPFSQKLAPLKGAKGPVFTCDEWRKIENDLLTGPLPEMKVSELDKLYSCLESRERVEAWNPVKNWEVAKRETKKEISELSRKNVFSSLAQINITMEKVSRDNPLYLRPDKWYLETNHRPSSQGEREPNIPEIFTQSIACQKLVRDGKTIYFTEPAISTADRKTLFNNALNETERLASRMNEESYSYCGQNCLDLVERGLARDSREHFADWLANRASWRSLARIPNAEDRRQASAAAWASFCEGSTTKREAPELALEEKKRSFEAHPEHRRRRLSIYDDFSASLVGCKLEPKKQDSYGTCEP